MILGVPTLCRYDLLGDLIRSVEKSTVRPSAIVVVDNGCHARHKLPTCDIELIEPGRNVGVSGAWNLLAETAVDRGEYLVISNDDIQLAADSLDKLLDSDAPMSGNGFALFVLKPDVFQAVGAFDENFWPAYYEDNDYARRMQVVGLKPRDLNLEELGCTHPTSETLHSFSSDGQRLFSYRFGQLMRYYYIKWGGPVGEEKYESPFNGAYPEGWSLRPVTVGGASYPEPWRYV